MPTRMNYQQARRVRTSKWTDLFVDQLVDKGVAGAIGKTISLKTQAKIKGIKEKFDPLNIAKFMTFGSKLGPALYGKLMGRDQKDIDYFTGRLKHVRITDKKAQKLKGVPTPSIGENVQGMNEQLGKIYTFLQKTHEHNVKQNEMNKNQEESVQMARDKRHQELMDTLKKLTSSLGGAPETLTPVEKKENWFDRIKKMFDDFAKDFDWKKYIPDIPWAKLMTVLRWFSGPIGLALLGLTSAVMFAEWLKGWIATNVSNKDQITPEQAVQLLKTPGADREIQKYGGRGALMDIAKNGHLKAQEILDRGDIAEINKSGGMEFLKGVAEKGAVDITGINEQRDLSQYEEQGPVRPTKGGAALKSKQEAWDQKWKGIYDPNTGKRLDKVSEGKTPEQVQQEEAAARIAPGVVHQSLSDPLKPVDKPVETPKSEPTPLPATSKVSTLTDKNVELNMPTNNEALAQSVTNTVTNVSKNDNERVGLRPSQISVRNDCDTFMEMIVNSTRIV